MLFDLAEDEVEVENIATKNAATAPVFPRARWTSHPTRR